MPIVAETREPTGHVATEHIAVETEASMPMDDIVAELASQQTDDAQAITSAARIIREGKQAEIRKLCKPWGVQLREKKASGKYVVLSCVVPSNSRCPISSKHASKQAAA